MTTETGMPVKKVAIGGAAGVAVTVLVLILNTYVPLFETKPITGELAAGLTTLASFFSAYFTPPARSESVIQVDGDMKSAVQQKQELP